MSRKIIGWFILGCVWLAVSIFINVILLAMVLFTIDGR